MLDDWQALKAAAEAAYHAADYQEAAEGYAKALKSFHSSGANRTPLDGAKIAANLSMASQKMEDWQSGIRYAGEATSLAPNWDKGERRQRRRQRRVAARLPVSLWLSQGARLPLPASEDIVHGLFVKRHFAMPYPQPGIGWAPPIWGCAMLAPPAKHSSAACVSSPTTSSCGKASKRQKP